MSFLLVATGSCTVPWSRSCVRVRASEVSCLDLLLGRVPCRKLYVGMDVPAQKYVIKANMVKFWGDIGNLGNTAMQRIRQDQTVMFKVGKKQTAVPASAIKGASPGIVNFNATKGVYDAQSSRFVYWDGLPEGDEETDLTHVDLFQYQYSDEDQSWWPVVALALEDDGEWTQLITWVGGKVFAICIYQLADTTLVAWPIEVSTWATAWRPPMPGTEPPP